MKSILKIAMMAAVCSATALMAEPLKIDGKFEVNEKNELRNWKFSGTPKNALLEAVESSDKKAHAAFVETAANSAPLAYRGLFRVNKYKDLTFSVDVRGNGGFAVQLHLYDQKDRHTHVLVLLRGGGKGDEVTTCRGKIDIPEEVNGRKIVYGRIHILSYPNVQLAYENVSLEGTPR